MTSGSDVVLQGPVMAGLIRAVAALTESGLEAFVIVGGVAVAARLGQAHRATTDVDTVIDEVAHPDAIETLLALPDAQPDPTGSHRVLIGGTKVEIIGVGAVEDNALDGLTELQTLFVSAHTWALSTATPVTLASGAGPTVRATGPFATPAALFAMKLHAIQDRRPTSRPEKRSSDALDLYRLLLQLDADGSLRADLASAPSPLRYAVRAATQRVLIDDAARTRGWLSASDDQAGQVTADELRYLARPVVDALANRGS
jgi:predicted nucleotidyltransferase